MADDPSAPDAQGEPDPGEEPEDAGEEAVDTEAEDADGEPADAEAADPGAPASAEGEPEGPRASEATSEAETGDADDRDDGSVRDEAAGVVTDEDGAAEGGPAPDEGDEAVGGGTMDEGAEAVEGAPGGERDEAKSAGDDGEVPPEVRKYQRFKKVDGAQYDRVNDFLRERTYITAREWAIARLCADFRTETGVEMTKIGENLDELVPFMEDAYSPQAVNQARSSFEEKVTKAGATFLYGAMSDFFTAEELDELMYEVTEVAKFLLEVEGVDLSVEDELAAEDRISGVMREVREASEALRYEECPHCGEPLNK